MALPDLDTSVGHSFGLDFDGVTIKQINEVSGLKMEQDVIELKQNTNDGKYMIKKLPGRPKAGEVTLTRGLTADTSFEKWIKDSRFGKMTDARKGGAIIVFDFEGQPIKRPPLRTAHDDAGDPHHDREKDQVRGQERSDTGQVNVCCSLFNVVRSKRAPPKRRPFSIEVGRLGDLASFGLHIVTVHVVNPNDLAE